MVQTVHVVDNVIIMHLLSTSAASPDTQLDRPNIFKLTIHVTDMLSQRDLIGHVFPRAVLKMGMKDWQSSWPLSA